MPQLRFALSLIVALCAAPVRGADLLQIYRDALANDSSYASARATRDAGLENLPQGLAQVLPTVNATAFTQYNNIDISFRGAAPDSQRLGNSNGFAVTLTQPLFNWQNIQVYKEAGFKAAQAEAVFGQATQDLIVRVAQAYFDVLASQDSLAFIQGQKVAISEQALRPSPTLTRPRRVSTSRPPRKSRLKAILNSRSAPCSRSSASSPSGSSR